jgi:short-subunit dehydrogenase
VIPTVHGLVAVALAREGVDLVINARRQDALKATAEQIGAETGVKVLDGGAYPGRP